MRYLKLRFIMPEVFNNSKEYIAISSEVSSSSYTLFRDGKQIQNGGSTLLSNIQEHNHKILPPKGAVNDLRKVVKYPIDSPTLELNESKQMTFTVGAYLPQLKDYTTITLSCTWTKSNDPLVIFTSLLNNKKSKEAAQLLGRGIQKKMFPSIDKQVCFASLVPKANQKLEVQIRIKDLKKRFKDNPYAIDAWSKIQKFSTKYQGQIHLLKWRAVDRKGIPRTDVLYVLIKIDKQWLGNSLEEFAEEEQQQGNKDTTYYLTKGAEKLKQNPELYPSP